ncbi:MAG: hypothetical protein ABI868_15435 [Acidobacteriota bacterium]
MADLKQPAIGIAATAMVIAISLGFVSLFDFPTFSGWVTYFLLCVIPIQIVMAVTWGTRLPGFAAAAGQPLKGSLLVLFALGIGVVVAAVYHRVAGAALSPPPPMLMMCTIVSVPVMFWAAIMWGGWPFTALIRNQMAAGLVMLAAVYLVNYGLFRIFFDYGFMQGAPVYVPSLDPHGLFNAWKALVFYVTALAAMFGLLCFDLWPMTIAPAVMKQPLLGLVWTLLALAIGGLAFYLGVEAIGMDPNAFLVRVPVPFIFGSIIVLNMLQGSLFAAQTQPVKGVLNVIAVAVIGSVLSRLYAALAPIVTGPLTPGPPAYDFEIWLASALLAVTFPFLIFHAEFFKMWPLKRSDAGQT